MIFAETQKAGIPNASRVPGLVVESAMVRLSADRPHRRRMTPNAGLFDETSRFYTVLTITFGARDSPGNTSPQCVEVRFWHLPMSTDTQTQR